LLKIDYKNLNISYVEIKNVASANIFIGINGFIMAVGFLNRSFFRSFLGFLKCVD
jgi:adenosine/AMP kinase